MPRTLGVDQPYLARLAANKLYNHLSSLRALRAHLTKQRHKKRSRRCKGCHSNGSENIPKEVYDKVVSDPKFGDDMMALKELMSAENLIMKVGSLRATW